VAAPVEAAPDEAAPGEDEGPVHLSTVARLGWWAIGLQFVLVTALSVVIYRRFALTLDYGIFNQARWLIGHGHLDPYDTLGGGGGPFWQGHGEWLMWPLGLLSRVWPGDGFLLLVQDVAVGGITAVAFAWVLDVVRDARLDRRAALAGVALVLLLLNPWVYWATEFDFHIEALATLFVLLAAYDLWRGRTGRMWVWVVLALSTGDITGTYLFGVGLAGLLVGRHEIRCHQFRGWLPALALVVIGPAWVAAMAAIHADAGSALGVTFGYLGGSGSPSSLAPLHRVVVLTAAVLHAGARNPFPSVFTNAGGIWHLFTSTVRHPSRPLRELWHHRLNLWANAAPAGLIGLCTPFGFAVPVVVLVTNNLVPTQAFSAPSFQSVPTYSFVSVGTVMALGRLVSRVGWRRRLGTALSVLVVAQTLAWAVVWLPKLEPHWLRVTPGAAAVLARAEPLIPSAAEVIASQGVVGRFSDHAWVFALNDLPTTYMVASRTVYFVFAPDQGVETTDVTDALEALDDTMTDLGGRLVASGDGIFVVRWDPPPRTTFVTLQHTSSIPAWELAGAAGASDQTGPDVAQWHAVSNGAEGDVVGGDYWRDGPGDYLGQVDLAASGPIDLDCWDVTTGALLYHRYIPIAPGRETIEFDLRVQEAKPGSAFSGYGPFSISPTEPLAGHLIEVRVWNWGKATVAVYGVSLAPVRVAGGHHAGRGSDHRTASGSTGRSAIASPRATPAP
jgi:hypothetical protein